MQSILSQLKPGGVPYAASQCGIERRRINQIAKEKRSQHKQIEKKTQRNKPYNKKRAEGSR